LIEKAVYSEFETYAKNKTNSTINYAHVDSVNIFSLIEEILAQPRNNPVQQFDKYIEIERWLKDQWAGLFKEMLSRSTGQRQIASLAAQVGELAEVNKTLRSYLEQVVSKIVPDQAAKLIATESKRLEEARRLADMSKNPLARYLVEAHAIPPEEIRDVAVHASSFDDFLQILQTKVSAESAGKLQIAFERSRPRVLRDLNQIRETLGASPLAEPEIESAGQ
jgi:hypothetical protein